MLPPHRLFLWSLIVGLLLSSNHAVAQEEAVEESESPAGRRQLWDFFSLLNMVGGCGPGPLGDHCRRNKAAEEAAAEATTTTTASAATTQTSAAEYYEEPTETAATADYGGKQTNNNNTFGTASASFSWWMIATAGSVMAALFAMHMGQRKNRSSAQRHEMAGSVVRRNGAVTAFADACLPGTSKVVELGGVEVKDGYRLDYGPEGVETTPGYELA